MNVDIPCQLHRNMCLYVPTYVQVLDQEIWRDTCVAYLRNFISEEVSYVAAFPDYDCFSLRVYDGSHSLYVTFDNNSFSSFVVDSTRDTKHPLVGAELLISICAHDVYGRLCQDVELCQELGDGVRESFRVGDPSDLVPGIRFQHQMIHLMARDVEFVRFAPTPAVKPRDAMGELIISLTKITNAR